MSQGRAIGKHFFIWTAGIFLSVANPSATWSARPSHANNYKQSTTTDQSKRKKERWAVSSNSAPTIFGTPDTTVLQDRAYDFLPTTNDPDGDTLSFSVTNLPRWATFDDTSGRLLGTPSLGDIGLYSNIVIAVSDGQASNELPPFAIDVFAYANGVATLSWASPATNTDGSPLLDLTGYEVHWGPQSGSYPYSVEIPNPGITTYMVENLTAGTHYFAVRALNAQGIASTFSNEAVKSIAP